MPNGNIDLCIDQCNQVPGCVMAAFTTIGDSCYLWSAVSTFRQTSTQVISAVKVCR
jgi:hypothetical protein